ncbi:MAG: carboxypeptidase regulatory-like domain-containing protein, partial [Bryobacteraceae bacterium]|nr:carboxypeptidase regulatory-like domain-containing protein [Bryobacteraceae bacterium]
MNTAQRLKFFAYCSLLMSLSTIRAQTTFGTVTGTVTDASGAVIRDAQITIVNDDTGGQRRTRSGDSGVFTASNLNVGFYRVQVSAPNF